MTIIERNQPLLSTALSGVAAPGLDARPSRTLLLQISEEASRALRGRLEAEATR